MTWYFLVMASVAVAAVLAGFCMGRLSGGNDVVAEVGGSVAGSAESRRSRDVENGRRMTMAGLWGTRDRAVTDRAVPGRRMTFTAEQAGNQTWYAGPDQTGEADEPGAQEDMEILERPGRSGTDRRRDPHSRGMSLDGRAGRHENAGGTGKRSSAGGMVREYATRQQAADRTQRYAGSTAQRVPGLHQGPDRHAAGYNRPGLAGMRKGRGRQTAEEGTVWSVGSPVSGEVAAVYEGEHPAVEILPAEDRICAPVGGKVMHLFPMGNALLFRTDFGTELYIQVGNSEDELLGRYYRPRVLKNEIVGKGKVLLEFDRKSLVAEGISPVVTVSVAECTYGSDVQITASDWAGSGEEILKVREIL